MLRRASEWRLFLFGFAMMLGASVMTSGCSKAKQAKSSEFVSGHRMSHDPALPFHQVWRQPELRWEDYKKVYVAPVNTAYMFKTTEWEQGERKGQIEQDLQKVALYTQDAIKKAFREDAKKRLQVVDADTSEPGVLILEVALTEMVPSKVVLNTLGYAPFGIGLTIQAVRGMAEDRSTVAIEVRGRDAATREIVFMLADREAQLIDPVGVKGLTWYSHANGIIDTWAIQFVRVANRDRAAGEVIEDTKPVTLKPW